MDKRAMLRLLRMVGRMSGEGAWVRYEPAMWMRQQPTTRNRKRWSRRMRRLAEAGLVQRQTDSGRDRVRQVRLTAAGQELLDRHWPPAGGDDLGLAWPEALETAGL